jgi:ureidoacrylate peracid hydrolase
MTVDRDKLAAVSDPRRSALVVVDMQNDFCNPADYAESVPMLPRLQKLITESRRAGVQVIFTQVNHDATNDSTVWVSRRAPGRKDIVKAGTPGAQYHPDFQPQPGDIDIVKHRYSAFIGTPLEMNLRTLGIETLFMTGIATNVCVESTLRDAFQRDFYVVLVEDCCAAGTRALHEGTVDNTRRHFGGLVATSDEVVEAWSEVAARV